MFDDERFSTVVSYYVTLRTFLFVRKTWVGIFVRGKLNANAF